MTQEVREESNFWKFLSFGLGVSLIVCFVWMTRDAEEKELQITIPGGTSITAYTKDSKIDYDEILEGLYADSFGKDGLIGWLYGKDFFHFQDQRLVTALSERLCEPIPDRPLNDKIEAGKKCSDLPVANGLRDLASLYKVPFHHVGTIINVGISLDLDHRPSEGKANVCEEGELRGKKIALPI